MANRLLEWIYEKIAKRRAVEGKLPHQHQLTPSASRESLLISAAAATAKSPFFQKLPFEIRHSILRHAFAGYTVHVVVEPLEYIPTRSKRLPLLAPAKERLRCSMCSVVYSTRTPHDGLRPRGEWCRCWVDGFRSCDIGIMGWLLSCRQAYTESINISYARNTMHIRHDIIERLPKMILSQRLRSITSVEFRYVSYNLSMLKKSISETHSSIPLYGYLKDLLATLPHLRKLYLSIGSIVIRESGVVYGSITEVLEQNLIVPIDDILRKSDPLLRECNMMIHVTRMGYPFADDVRALTFSYFQGDWIRHRKKSIHLDDKSSGGGTRRESLNLRDPGSPSYTLQLVPEFAP